MCNGLRGAIAAAAIPLMLVSAGCRSGGRQPASRVSPSAGAQVMYPLDAEGYPWPRSRETYEPLAARFAPPRGFERVEALPGSFGEWMRHLPMLPERSSVVSLSGNTIPSGRHPSLAGVIDIDVRKHQECADVNMRLWAEYLRHAGREDQIAFRLTGGGTISWSKWKQGYRLKQQGGSVSFVPMTGPSSSRESFDEFLASVFAWCGTYSLSQEGRSVGFQELQIGDFLVTPGSPGHTVMIADLATNAAGQKRALLLQGYMPAQSVHILADSWDPWFSLDPDEPLDVPLWGEFGWDELRRLG